MGNLFSSDEENNTYGGDSLATLSLNSPNVISLSFLNDDEVMHGGKSSDLDKYNVFKMLNELEQSKKPMTGGAKCETNTLSHTELLNKLRKAVEKDGEQEGGNNELKNNFKQYLEQELNKIQEGGASCNQCGAMKGGCGCNKGGKKESSTSSSSGSSSSSSSSSSNSDSSSSTSSVKKNKKDKKKKHKKIILNYSESSKGGNATSESENYVNTSNVSDEQGLNIFPFNSATNSEYSSYSQKMLRRHL